MGEFDALAAEIYKDKVRRARLATPEEKFCAGQELFEMAAQFTLAGISQQYPGTDEATRLQHLRKRLALADVLERRSALGEAQ